MILKQKPSLYHGSQKLHTEPKEHANSVKCESVVYSFWVWMFCLPWIFYLVTILSTKRLNVCEKQWEDKGSIRGEKENGYMKFRGLCLVICSYNRSQQYALFLNFILVNNSTCFGQTYCPSSWVLIPYSQQLLFVILGLFMLTVC